MLTLYSKKKKKKKKILPGLRLDYFFLEESQWISFVNVSEEYSGNTVANITWSIFSDMT